MLELSFHASAGDFVTADSHDHCPWIIGQKGDQKALIFLTADSARQIVDCLSHWLQDHEDAASEPNVDDDGPF